MRLLVPAIVAALCGNPLHAIADDHIRIEPRDAWPWAYVEINHVEQFGMGGGADPGSYGVAGAWIEQGSQIAMFFEPSMFGCVARGTETFTQFRGRHACIEFDPDGCTVIVTEAGCGLDAQRLYEFLGAWFAGHMPQADFNHDGRSTTQDVFDYLSEVFRP